MDRAEQLLRAVYNFFGPVSLSSSPYGGLYCILCDGYDEHIEGVIVFHHTEKCTWEEMEELYG